MGDLTISGQVRFFSPPDTSPLNDDFPKHGQLVLALSLAVILGIIGIWDAWAIFSGKRASTVSEVIHEWSVIWPVLPFFVGLLMGHLFWR